MCLYDASTNLNTVQKCLVSRPDLAMKFTDEIDKIRIFDLPSVRLSQELGKTDRDTRCVVSSGRGTYLARQSMQPRRH